MSWDEGISRKSPNIFLQPIGNPQSIAPQSEAEKLQKQLDVEVAHLTPAIQRFWQRSAEFSPRSRRLSNLVPKPQNRNSDAMVLEKLKHLRYEVADTIEKSRKVQEMTGDYLKKHFASIPPHKLAETAREIFLSFDADHDGHLNDREMRTAFRSLGMRLGEQELHIILDEFDANSDGTFDPDEFEELVRTALHASSAAAPPAGPA
eukprot:CAMPEP_0113687462 /NCGR_PEP_ID=MMETSP0038_2-20120614/15951_1 /TAXON_ID=2898 /ORGANISM="Cryptomonas paramecium" /LENGTH=204 /DNA_ID=CAMNT_0000608083 /DNA_START=203 /DNA_END=813 /DNA_ORIENTATION=+ /assembly_acc=CAM_ASM_000170